MEFLKKKVHGRSPGARVHLHTDTHTHRHTRRHTHRKTDRQTHTHTNQLPYPKEFSFTKVRLGKAQASRVDVLKSAPLLKKVCLGEARSRCRRRSLVHTVNLKR